MSRCKQVQRCGKCRCAGAEEVIALGVLCNHDHVLSVCGLWVMSMKLDDAQVSCNVSMIIFNILIWSSSSQCSKKMLRVW